MDLTIRTVRSLSSVDPAAWNGLDHGSSPFLEHGFLRALEVSGSIGGHSGWNPYYLVAEGASASGADAVTGTTSPLLGAVCCFQKEHSYGEYIFDFGWAAASEKAGLAYYPKLVVAAPLTPATGPRLLLHPDLDDAGRKAVALGLVEAVGELCDALRCSSIHWLFTTAQEHALLTELGFMPRTSFQFHWHNREYGSFDEFLASLSSRKRKQIRKERERARQDVALSFVPGADMSVAEIAALDRFYRSTTAQHGGHDYLRPGFFEALVKLAPERVAFCRVTREEQVVAGALYLETDRALYGRYWGCVEDIPFLHFETAYYQGIERAIARQLPLFEAGAQGEHKLLRGFEPSPTYSSHLIRHEGLRRAVARFLASEAASIPSYMDELGRFLPYKRGHE